MPDFANILFAGPCNRRCYYCIGEAMPERVNVDNLDRFPPLGIDAFIDAVNRFDIKEIVFTGTVTDPQLYRHESALLTLLRERVRTGARYSVHTNGVLALRKMDVFNQYDRACISFPSFQPSTYARHMGSDRVPDLARIVERSTIPIKVSCVLDEHNVGEVEAFLRRCRDIGIRRVVLRKIFGDERVWRVLHGMEPVRHHRGNPVYDFDGIEVTYWDFDAAASTSINLFADGTLGSSYLLTKTPELRR
jgi:molybdenum cofactor biosynthesis enzyme MoaA